MFTVVDEVEEEPKSFAERQKKQREKMPFGQFKETFGRQKARIPNSEYQFSY